VQVSNYFINDNEPEESFFMGLVNVWVGVVYMGVAYK